MTNPKKYEAVLIFEGQFTEDQIAEQVTKTSEVITKNGGTVLGNLTLGKKRLAYPINRRREGIYVQIDFETATDNTVLAELNRHLRITEEIIRSLVSASVVGKSKGRDLTPDEMARFLPRGGGRRPGGPPRERYGSSSGPRTGDRPSYAPRDDRRPAEGAVPAAAPASAEAPAASAPAAPADPASTDNTPSTT